jgi:four helix bundle protein
VYIKSYRELIVWRKSLVLAEEVYMLTRNLPREELYCLTVQMRRSAISIPSNIAEGSRRKDLPEYLHFLRVSRGSAAELETQIILAKRLYPALDVKACAAPLIEVQRMLSVMITKMGAKLQTRYNTPKT